MRLNLRRIIFLLALTVLAVACSKEKESATEPSRAPAAAEMTGASLFQERCQDCHRVGGKGGVVGPDLSFVGAKRNAAFLEQVIREPSKIYPGTVMPPYDTLPAKQIDLLVDYLSGLR